MNRRTWMQLAGLAGAGYLATRGRAAEAVTLFDGKTLDGWIQIENNATSISSGALLDPASFAAKLTHGTDAVSLFLRDSMDDALKADLAAYSPSNANAKAVVSALVKCLNQVIAGPPITGQAHGSGRQLAHQNKLLIEGVYSGEFAPSSATGWIVKDSAMASTGSGRGVIYTVKDYNRYRLTFTMRHLSGNPDHQACILIFCARPQGDEVPLDALGGIQFQVPNGGHWDYRSGMNNAGGAEFNSVTKTHFEVHEWSRVEILADAAKGAARMAVAQPLGTKAVEVLDFNDPAAGKVGPVAWQMHNAGLFDEYKDIAIEIDPQNDELHTVK